jgi:hypothetical protein
MVVDRVISAHPLDYNNQYNMKVVQGPIYKKIGLCCLIGRISSVYKKENKLKAYLLIKHLIAR